MQDKKLIVGFYIDEPPVWICRDGESINPKQTMTNEEYRQVVFNTTLPMGIEVFAQRQGCIIAAFPEELLSIKVSEIKTANLLPMSAAQFSLDFFNAFLFLLYDQTYKYHNQAYGSIKQAINVSNLWRWTNREDADLISIITEDQPTPILKQHGTPNIFDLINNVNPILKQDGIPNLIDILTFSSTFRATRHTTVVNKTLEVMFSNSDYEINKTNWQLMALLNKALWSIQRAEFAEAHILSWAVAEKLIETEWEKYIDSTNQSIGEQGEKTVNTVNSDRKKSLVSANYDASKKIEILELAKVISYDLYKRLTKARQTRNRWIHGLKPVTQEDCTNCYLVARDMMSRKLNNYCLEHPGSYYFQDEDMPTNL
jgi:hypothetical protein